MKWSKEEIENCLTLFKKGKSFDEVGKFLNRTKKSVKEKLNELGYKQSDYYIQNKHLVKECLQFNKSFDSLISNKRKFCSHTCSTIFNNKLKPKRVRTIVTCLFCGETKKCNGNKFCSSQCGGSYKRKIIFDKIENGDITLYYRNYKNYLIEKYGNQCMECGWGKVNPLSGKIPVELEHIDGNSENNSLDNLKLLCPNCHSLTPTYKALNMGNGRHKRMERYNEGKSY